MNSLLISKSVYSAASKLLFPSTFTPSNLSNPVCLQCVRWRRKPRWLPTAKTKMFRITKRVRLPPEEGVEFLRLTNNYRTALKAIRFHLSEKIKSQTTAPEVIAEQLRLQEEDHLKCVKLNEDWNKEVAKIREERVAEAAEKLKLLTLEEIYKLKEIEEEEVQRIEMMVRAEKEKSKSFITPKNIDEALEKALNDTVDYNYCIDLEGNVYKGIRARPGVSKPDSKINDGDNDNDSTVKQAAKQ